jgi:hypothetical protein
MAAAAYWLVAGGPWGLPSNLIVFQLQTKPILMILNLFTRQEVLVWLQTKVWEESVKTPFGSGTHPTTLICKPHNCLP